MIAFEVMGSWEWTMGLVLSFSMHSSPYLREREPEGSMTSEGALSKYLRVRRSGDGGGAAACRLDSLDSTLSRIDREGVLKHFYSRARLSSLG